LMSEILQMMADYFKNILPALPAGKPVKEA
jgi:hypothetical protein